MMEKRQYKQTDYDLSLLGFGCMRLPTLSPRSTQIDVPKAEQLVDYAYEHGVNYFDTAYIYHEGGSEAFLGQALSKYPRASFSLATKMPPFRVRSAGDLERIFQEQLDKCRVDYFDFYLIHSLSYSNYAQSEQYQIYDYLCQQKAKGKIKHLGFSFHDEPELLEQIVAEHQWDFGQLQINYMDWVTQDAARQYRILTELGIPIVAMEPVRGGALARLNDKAAALLKAADPNSSIASWALRWAASLPNVMTVLSGMSTLEQVEDNVQTFEKYRSVSRRELEIVEEALEVYRESGVIPCTACGYCMPCPAGVDIPKVLSAYNSNCIDTQDWKLLLEYRVIGEQHTAANCTKCLECLEKCPQKIAIGDWMDKVDEMVAKAQSDSQ